MSGSQRTSPGLSPEAIAAALTPEVIAASADRLQAEIARRELLAKARERGLATDVDEGVYTVVEAGWNGVRISNRALHTDICGHPVLPGQIPGEMSEKGLHLENGDAIRIGIGCRRPNPETFRKLSSSEAEAAVPINDIAVVAYALASVNSAINDVESESAEIANARQRIRALETEIADHEVKRSILENRLSERRADADGLYPERSPNWRTRVRTLAAAFPEKIRPNRRA